MQPSFWGTNVRVRVFKGNGTKWVDREQELGDDEY